MPFVCDACGAGRDLTQLPAHGAVLRCPRCGHERAFVRPRLLIVTGTSGAGKSTVCARLAGRIPGAVLLDADVFAGEMVSVVPPNDDFVRFWRSMGLLAHEIAQSDLTTVLFSVMLPEQLLTNRDVVDYFESVHFLILTTGPGTLHDRFDRRAVGADPATVGGAVERWSAFDESLREAARTTPNAHVIDARRPAPDVERDVGEWIRTTLVA